MVKLILEVQKKKLVDLTYNIHELGDRIHDDGKKKYRPLDCINPNTNKNFDRIEAREFVAFLIKKYRFFKEKEDLRGKSGWYSQDERGFPRAFIFFYKSVNDKNKSLFIKFNVQYVEYNKFLNRGCYFLNMLSFHPSYNLNNKKIKK